jgi:hypothetical protein
MPWQTFLGEERCSPRCALAAALLRVARRGMANGAIVHVVRICCP